MFEIETIVVESGKDTREAAMKHIETTMPGCMMIGHGLYANVYATNESDRVLKIGTFSDMDGYSTYVKVLSKCKTHNPFTPKIFSVKVFTPSAINSHGKKYYVVELERLKPFDLKKDPARKFISEQLYAFDRGGVIRVISETLGVRTTMPTPLRSAIKLLVQAKKKSGCGWDLHEQNVMMRGDQIVVTDPLS